MVGKLATLLEQPFCYIDGFCSSPFAIVVGFGAALFMNSKYYPYAGKVIKPHN